MPFSTWRIVGFLKMGNELELPESHLENQISFHSIRPNWHFAIGRRIFNDNKHPAIFYVMAMGIILTSILSVQNLNWSWAQLQFFRVEGSYLYGLVFFLHHGQFFTFI